VNVLLWIAQGLVAAGFLGSGLMKLTASPKKRADMIPFLPPVVGLIMGFVDVIGAAGVILPAATGIAPVLTPIAAVGTAIVMAGAIPVHLKLKDPPGVVSTTVLLLLSVFIAWGRFGPYAL
jgi:DoxX-like protein